MLSAACVAMGMDVVSHKFISNTSFKASHWRGKRPQICVTVWKSAQQKLLGGLSCTPLLELSTAERTLSKLMGDNLCVNLGHIFLYY